MKKIKRIFMMIFMIALCFSLKTNVNAVTLPELKIGLTVNGLPAYLPF